jgi:DNA-binding NarL/FixJ family response regulator
MTAARPGRRSVTARELGERFNRSPRTIRRIVAQPRDEFEAEARERQAQALNLRSQGLSYGQIAKELGITRDAASGLVRRGRRNNAPATTTATAA